MSIESPDDLTGMEFAGKVTRAVLEAMKAAVRPGVSTRELDDIGTEGMKTFGAQSAPKEGLIFTIEPLIAIGTSRTVVLRDGWTVRTRDRSLAAHHEHTVLVTKEGARLLTHNCASAHRLHFEKAENKS